MLLTHTLPAQEVCRHVLQYQTVHQLWAAALGGSRYMIVKSTNISFSFLTSCPFTALLLVIQDRVAARTAPQNTSGGRQHPAVHGSSLLQSKDSKTLAAARSQEVAHGSGRHSQEGVNDDTAGSPELHQQVGVAFGCLHVACTALQGSFS